MNVCSIFKSMHLNQEGQEGEKEETSQEMFRKPVTKKSEHQKTRKAVA